MEQKGYVVDSDLHLTPEMALRYESKQNGENLKQLGIHKLLPNRGIIKIHLLETVLCFSSVTRKDSKAAHHCCIKKEYGKVS